MSEERKENKRDCRKKGIAHGGTTSRKINIPWKGGCTGWLALGDASVLDGVQRSEKTTDGDGARRDKWEAGRNFVFQKRFLPFSGGEEIRWPKEARKRIRLANQVSDEETHPRTRSPSRFRVLKRLGRLVEFNWA